MPDRLVSKNELQRQLPHAGGHGLGENSARVPGGVGGRSGVEEIRMVQDVEVLAANLEHGLFTELELLEQRRGGGSESAAGSEN